MLTGENINLRPLRLGDWEKTLQWRNDQEIKTLAMMHPFPITEIMEKEWYVDLLKNKSNKVIYYAITEKDDNTIGFIFLKSINQIHRNCSLGIIIGDTKHQGKGYGSEAIKILTKYAFDRLNINKVTVEVVDQNKKATSIYEKLGFIHEGCLKEQFFSDGVYYDVLLMSLFRTQKSG